MLVTNGRLLHRFDEAVREGARLGRHLELDARSLAYAVERELEALLRSPHIRPVEHLPTIGILDQGNLGSCTGNAGAYALSSLVGSERLSQVRLDGLGLSSDDATANERFAVALYHEATVEDGFPGTYPPDDSGSSGIGVCRALKRAELIGRYRWATTARGFAAMLQDGGVMLGLPWYSAFFDPSPAGFIDADLRWMQSGIAGGHEVFCEAIEAWDNRDLNRCILRFSNSWSRGWGASGRGRLRMSTYEAIKQQCDVKALQVAA